jgi:hypothetical protein
MIKANRFVHRFKPTSAEKLKGELEGLQQVLHLSRKRPSEDDLKLGLDKALRLYSWLEPNVKKFASELGEVNQTYKALWIREEPASQKEVLGPTLAAQGPPASTNHILQTKITNTSEVS